MSASGDAQAEPVSARHSTGFMIALCVSTFGMLRALMPRGPMAASLCQLVCSADLRNDMLLTPHGGLPRANALRF